MKLSKVFQNKYLLYFVLVVAVTNVLGYLAMEQYNAVTFFLAIGLLSSYFTKNMSVVLLISILSTAFASIQRVIEGMENKSATDEKMNDKNAENVPEKPDANGVCKAEDPNDDDNCDGKLETDCVGKCKWNPITTQPEKESIKATEKAKGKNVDEFKKFCMEGLADANGATHTSGDGNDMKYFKQHLYDNQGKCPIASSVESCENSKDCQQYKSFSGEKFTNMGKRNNIVANTSREGRVDGVDEGEGDRIDYAETTKQAYDNLQKMLGADGMKGLASETKNLVAQQKELVDSLGQMAPVLNSAKSTLDSLNLPDMKGITNILSTLKGK